MISFRTEINPDPSDSRISHETRMLLTGSCFAVNIGTYLKEHLFPVRINPFGVVYNPVSVLNTLGILLDGEKYDKEDLEFRDEIWFSWDHHSSFSASDPDTCLNRINSEIEASSTHLRECRILLITFGTAWVYRLKRTGKIVSNCHKIPAREFDRILLDPPDIFNVWSNFLDELFTIIPELRVIFTISPVRHWKEGAHGNQLSKSVLHLAVEKLLKSFPGKTEYFPAYEILLDDLRDYRFYADDLLHPGTQAIEYIQEKFNLSYFDPKTIELNKEILKLLKARNHRMYNQNSDASSRFRYSQLETIKKLAAEHPYLNFDDLRNYFS